MMERIEKMGYSEVTALTMIFLGAKVFLGYPRYMAQVGATAGWLVALFSGLLAIGFWLVIARLLARFPGQSLLAISEELLGSYLGMGVNLLFLAYLIIGSSILLRLYSEVLILTTLPEAPISSLIFLFIIPVLYVAYLGIEAIGRSNFITMPFIVIGILLVFLALFPYYTLGGIFPFLGKGLPDLFLYSLLTTTSYDEILILAILVPYFSFDSQALKRVGVFSLAAVIVIFTLSTLFYLMVIPYPGATESLTPFYQMTRSIVLGRYVQRVESIFVLFWALTAFFRLATGVFLGAVMMKKILHIPYYRPLLPAVAILYMSLSLTLPRLMDLVELERVRILYGWTVAFIIPCGLFFLALVRGKGGKNNEKIKDHS